MKKSTGLFTKQNLIAFIMLTAGAVIAAFSVEEFLVPSQIFDGGVTGISMIVGNFVNIPLGAIIIVINLPFMIFGLVKLGKGFILRALYAIIVFSVFTSVFEHMKNATYDAFLGTIFGGVILGVGVGLVFRGGGVLDGTEVVATYLSRKTSWSTAKIVLIMNVAIYLIAGIVFGLDRGMYSLVMYFITSRVIDIVEIGRDNTKSVMIVSDDGKEIAKLIYERLGRTVTLLKGKGLVSREEKDVLYCVITRAEMFELRKLLEEVPGSSFTTISDVSEILGNHIKSNSERKE
ncbi:MAG: YitT family protein [Lachnospiraceae bacterium]|nr:YitT family protein [Lachnospiraceae bacterium]